MSVDPWIALAAIDKRLNLKGKGIHDNPRECVFPT